MTINISQLMIGVALGLCLSVVFLFFITLYLGWKTRKRVEINHLPDRKVEIQMPLDIKDAKENIVSTNAGQCYLFLKQRDKCH